MDIDTSRMDSKTVNELIRLSELYLDGTVRFALASDARATSLAGLMASVSMALIAAGLALQTSIGVLTEILKISVVMSAFVASFVLIIAISYCVRAARPRPFHIAGNHLSHWNSESDLYGELKLTLIEQVKIYNEQINENNRVLIRNADLLSKAILCLLATPIVASAVGLLAYYSLPQLQIILLGQLAPSAP